MFDVKGMQIFIVTFAALLFMAGFIVGLALGAWLF